MTKDEIEFTLVFALPVPAIIGLIFSSPTTFIVLFALFGFVSARYIINTRDRKEQLMITKHNDDIILMLTDDDYLRFNIADIKDDSHEIYERTKEVVSMRAKELKSLVDRVVIYNNQDKSKETELLSIINAAA